MDSRLIAKGQKGRRCAICGKVGGTAMTIPLRQLREAGAKLVNADPYAHADCMARLRKERAELGPIPSAYAESVRLTRDLRPSLAPGEWPARVYAGRIDTFSEHRLSWADSFRVPPARSTR